MPRSRQALIKVATSKRVAGCSPLNVPSGNPATHPYLSTSSFKSSASQCSGSVISASCSMEGIKLSVELSVEELWATWAPRPLSVVRLPVPEPLHTEGPCRQAEPAEPQQEDASNACQGRPTCPRQGPPDHDNPNLCPGQCLMQPQQGRQMTWSSPR